MRKLIILVKVILFLAFLPSLLEYLCFELFYIPVFEIRPWNLEDVSALLLSLLRFLFLFSLCWCLLKYPKPLPKYIWFGLIAGEAASLAICREIVRFLSENPEPPLDMITVIFASISGIIGVIIIGIIAIPAIYMKNTPPSKFALASISAIIIVLAATALKYMQFLYSG